MRGARPTRSVHSDLGRLSTGTGTSVPRRTRRRDDGAGVGGGQRSRTRHRHVAPGGCGQQRGRRAGGAARSACPPDGSVSRASCSSCCTNRCSTTGRPRRRRSSTRPRDSTVPVTGRCGSTISPEHPVVGRRGARLAAPNSTGLPSDIDHLLGARSAARRGGRLRTAAHGGGSRHRAARVPRHLPRIRFACPRTGSISQQLFEMQGAALRRAFARAD